MRILCWLLVNLCRPFEVLRQGTKNEEPAHTSITEPAQLKGCFSDLSLWVQKGQERYMDVAFL